MHSAILIIPAALIAQANAVGAAMGWGPDNYTIPLSSDGETVTHWGARADVSPALITCLRVKLGQIPPPENPTQEVTALMAALDAMDQPALMTVLTALIADFSPDPTIFDDPRPVLWGRDHLDAVLLANGMVML